MKKTYAPVGAPPTEYGRANAGEDWAESVTAVVDPAYVSGWQQRSRQEYVGWDLTVGMPSQNAFRRWAR